MLILYQIARARVVHLRPPGQLADIQPALFDKSLEYRARLWGQITLQSTEKIIKQWLELTGETELPDAIAPFFLLR